jgi:hypothetical protein
MNVDAYVTPVNALLVFMLVGVVVMMYRFNRYYKHYNIVDLLIGSDGRASITNHILLSMVALSVWVVVDRELALKDDVSTILLGVLAIFVTGKTATAITDTLNRPAPPSPPPPPLTAKTTRRK